MKSTSLCSWNIANTLSINKYAFVITDFARVSKITIAPQSGCQHIELQRLTKFRLYLIENISLEKSYIISNIPLKLSELAVLDNAQNPFLNTFNASSLKTLAEFMIIEELTNSELENLIVFLVEKVKIDFLIPKRQPSCFKYS